MDATTGRPFAPVRQTLEIGGNSLPPLKESVTDLSLLFERAPVMESLHVLASERVWFELLANRSARVARPTLEI